jgi:hypothetical protein
LKTKFPAASEISPISRKFQVFLTEKIGAQSGPNLRDVATSLGMKSELPNNSAALLNAILQYLEKLHEDDRADRIKGAVNYVQQRSPNPSDDYSRWVSLITKK